MAKRRATRRPPRRARKAARKPAKARTPHKSAKAKTRTPAKAKPRKSAKAKTAGQRAKPRRAVRGRRLASSAAAGEVLAAAVADRPARSSRLTGGDVDADLERAGSSGEEAVGGSEPTPDQDNVDMIGDALGVGRAPTAEVIASSDILDARDRRRRRAEARAEDQP